MNDPDTICFDDLKPHAELLFKPRASSSGVTYIDREGIHNIPYEEVLRRHRRWEAANRNLERLAMLCELEYRKGRK